MTTRFNILLSPDGIALADSASPDEELYRAAFDPQALQQIMEELRESADDWAPDGWDSVLLLPEDQVLYTRLTVGDAPDQQDAIRAGLQDLTPYDVADLRFDWAREDEFTVQIAAVATETLQEAEEFAASFNLNPIGFASAPDATRFPRQPWFGPTQVSLQPPPRQWNVVADKPRPTPAPDPKAATGLQPAPPQTPGKNRPEQVGPATGQKNKGLRQLALACAAALALTGGLWFYLASTPPPDPAPAPADEVARVAESPDIANESVLDPTAQAMADGFRPTQRPPAPPDLPQPVIRAGAEIRLPPTVVDAQPDLALPWDDRITTPRLIALPALPEPATERAAPILRTTPAEPQPVPPSTDEAAAEAEPAEEMAADSAPDAPDPQSATDELSAEEAATGQAATAQPDTDPDTAPADEQTALLAPDQAPVAPTEPLPDTPADTQTTDVEATAEAEQTGPEPAADLLPDTEAIEAEEPADVELVEEAPDEPIESQLAPPEVLPGALADFRPVARPDSIEPRPDLRVVVADAETPGYRPLSRPAALAAPRPPVIVAVAPPIRPTARPARLSAASIDAAVREARTEPSTPAPSAAPRIPTAASIAERATDENALRLRQINLIGVFGSKGDRRALVRLSSGRILRLEVRDRLDGGRVSAITDDQLVYVKRGKNVVLKMPQG